MRGAPQPQAAAVPYAERGVDIERAMALILLIFIVYGAFFPPESYFVVHSFGLNEQSEPANGPYYGRYGYALALVWIMYQFVRHLNVMLGALRRAWLPLLFCVITLVSSFWAVDVGGAANRGARMLIITLFAVYFVRRFDPTELVGLLAYAVLITAAASVFAVLVFPAFALSSLSGYGGAWNGALGHKNSFGALMATGTIIMYYAYVFRKIRFVFFISSFSLCFILTVLSKSATALVSLLVSFPIIYLLAFIASLRRQVDRILALLTGFAIISCGTLVLSSVSDLLFDLIGRDANFTGRDAVWQATWSAIQANPVIGYGHAFWSLESPLRNDIWRQLNWAPPHAHNTLLDVWLQLGLAGVFVLISMIIVMLRYSVSLALDGMNVLTQLCIVFLMQLIIRGATETVLLDINVTGMFWFTVIYSCIQVQFLGRFKRIAIA